LQRQINRKRYEHIWRIMYKLRVAMWPRDCKDQLEGM
jgi:hypothetical protein